MTDESIVISSISGMSPEQVAAHVFGASFRGYDQNEVRHFLRRVADQLRESIEAERSLQEALRDAQRRAAHPEVDEEMLTTVLGEQTARVLQAAREAAADIRARAEENAARLLRDADDEATRRRSEAESVLERRRDEAEHLASGIRRAAEEEAAAMRERARTDSESELESARSRGKEMVTEAQAVRERVLTDLARRRRLAHVQIEQLRAGRERLLDAYRVVRRTLDEATEELGVAEVEARVAAESAARRVAAEPEPTAAELDAELEATRPADLPSAPLAPLTPLVDVERPTFAPVSLTSLDEPAEGGDEVVPLKLVEPEDVNDLRFDPAIDPVVDLDDPTSAEAAIAPVEAAERGDRREPEPSDADPVTESDTPVDTIFARIRADRAAAVADAQRVLEVDQIAARADDTMADAGAVLVAGEEATGGSLLVDPTLDGDRLALERRDATLVPLQEGLARKLKRALQDEQNEVLDTLRQVRGRPTAEKVLPSPFAHEVRHREAARALLADAGRAGIAATDPGAPLDLPVEQWAGELAADLVGPLRDRLERALAEAGPESGEGEGEEEAGDDAVSERVNAGYRQCRSERIEPLARHHLVVAYARAAFAAIPDGTPQRWVVDDEGGPCPDCDDNALAGATPKGQPFPTGQAQPPAHVGCRCLLVADGA